MKTYYEKTILTIRMYINDDNSAFCCNNCFLGIERNAMDLNTCKKLK